MAVAFQVVVGRTGIERGGVESSSINFVPKFEQSASSTAEASSAIVDREILLADMNNMLIPPTVARRFDVLFPHYGTEPASQARFANYMRDGVWGDDAATIAVLQAIATSKIREAQELVGRKPPKPPQGKLVELFDANTDRSNHIGSVPNESEITA